MRFGVGVGICATAIVALGGAAQAGDPFYGRVPVTGPDEALVLYEPAPPVYPDYRIRARYVAIPVINHAGVLYNHPLPVGRPHYYPAVISARY
ncbi:hypothetical protein [Alsobacter metallidurans]|uniref:hypothetical protein n=1 Tax=Alsobacter metallidurans TaxID=340221 RepID=UPI001665B028|nr:hypothetical protein [Alsobacter metallidurans]